MTRRARLRFVLGAVLALGLVAPVASAKVYFPVKDSIFVAGTYARLAVPGCAAIGTSGCIATYPGPVRMYLVRADVPLGKAGAEASEPPRPARALGRLGDRGRLYFKPHAAGRFRLVALATVGTGDDLRTQLWPVSAPFTVHPRGWEPAG